MVAAWAALLAAALVAATLLPVVNAHAGHFHLCPDTPSGRNYVRAEIGNCTTFLTLNATSNMTMTGKVTMWLYTYKNCSNSVSSALEFDSKILQNGQVVPGLETGGYAHIGTCASPGAYYMQDPSQGTNSTNMIFWQHADADNTTGAFCGNAANALVVRTKDISGNLQADAARSVVVYTEAYGATLCCDLDLFAKPAVATLTSTPGVVDCSAAPPPQPASNLNSGAAPPPPSGGAAGASRVGALALLGVAVLVHLLL